MHIYYYITYLNIVITIFEHNWFPMQHNLHLCIVLYAFVSLLYVLSTLVVIRSLPLYFFDKRPLISPDSQRTLQYLYRGACLQISLSFPSFSSHFCYYITNVYMNRFSDKNKIYLRMQCCSKIECLFHLASFIPLFIYNPTVELRLALQDRPD